MGTGMTTMPWVRAYRMGDYIVQSSGKTINDMLEMHVEICYEMIMCILKTV